MLPTLQDPGFAQLAQSAISEYCKDVEEITYIEHGVDNIVAVVNKRFVFRFPRREDAAKRLAYETALLQMFGKAIHSVASPKVLQVHTMPLYVVSDYIAGEHLTVDQIKALSEEEQVAVGRTIAAFVVELNKAISSLQVQRLRNEAQVDSLQEEWAIRFDRQFMRERLPNDRLRPVVEEYYTMWKDYVVHEQRTLAIHDDLHPANLLFVGSKLNGVVDFGEANTGSVEEELRWVYSMGDIVLKAAIGHYQQLTGQVINADHVRVWVIMQELSAYTRDLARQQTDSYPFKRAEAHLREWIPNFPL